MEDSIIQAMLNTVKENLNDSANEIVEKKVAEFRSELLRDKDRMVTEMMSAIEINTQRDIMTGGIQFNILVRPKVIVKKD